MLYMSCTLCIYRSIGNKQRFHRPLQSLSTHRLVMVSIIAVTRCRADLRIYYGWDNGLVKASDLSLS